MPADANKLHLAIVVTSIVPGSGVANVARAQAIALSQHFAVSLFTGYGNIEQPDINQIRVQPAQLNWLRRLGHVTREYLFCLRAKRALDKTHTVRPIDFILFHSHSGAAIAGNNLPIKHGVVIHGDIFSRPSGSYDPLLTQLYRWASRVAYRTADLVVALSPAMKNAALKHGATEDRVHIIPNGVDISAPEPAPRAGNKLLFIGRLAVEKDPLTLLNAFSVLVQNNPNLSLSVAGDGPLKKQCEDCARELDIQQNVRFLGHCSGSEISELYRSHDILCVPSISDPLPTVILEAMQYRLPVVGANCDGIPFLLENGKSGKLFSAQDVNAFAKELTALISSPSLREQVAASAQIHLQRTFSRDTVTKQLVEEIRRLKPNNC